MGTSVSNRYSDDWYGIFLETIPAEATRTEVAFVERHLPPDAFLRLLDLCCGSGRHAVHLARRGYHLFGLDASARAIGEARASCPQGLFQVGDMRRLEALQRTFDGVINLWHSFGYFDDETNRDVLRQVRDALRPGGRALFDIYNRDHFAQRPLQESSERGGRTIRTVRSWHGARLRVVLHYDGRPGDVFEWRLYTPPEFQALCDDLGLHTLLSCAWFDEDMPPAAQHARMQFLLERGS
jgi:SAM-dependent methyltransferase